MIDFSQYSFVFNAAAYFNAIEKYPDGFIEPVISGGRDSFDAICWFLQELSTQGERIRRHYGMDKHEVLLEETARMLLKPTELTEARDIIVDAVVKGMSVGDDDEEVDEVLLELQKKTTSD